MPRSISDLKVGDTVHWTDVNIKGLHSGKVSKIGRKYIKVGIYEFHKDTGVVHSAYTHQTLVADVDEYHRQQQRNKLIRLIRHSHRLIPDSVTLEDVQQAAKLLGLTEESNG